MLKIELLLKFKQLAQIHGSHQWEFAHEKSRDNRIKAIEFENVALVRLKLEMQDKE